MLLYARELQTAATLAPCSELITELRLDLARDDPEFQSFMTEYVRPARNW
jgi:hypothetical protein